MTEARPEDQSVTLEAPSADNLLVWQQIVYQQPGGTVDIQMGVHPELKKHMQKKHYGLIESVVKQIVGECIESMKRELDNEQQSKIILP